MLSLAIHDDAECLNPCPILVVPCVRPFGDQLFTETMKAKAEGIAASDMAPVSLMENLGRVSADRIETWRNTGLRAIAAGEVRWARPARERVVASAVGVTVPEPRGCVPPSPPCECPWVPSPSPFIAWSRCV